MCNSQQQKSDEGDVSTINPTKLGQKFVKTQIFVNCKKPNNEEKTIEEYV